MNSSQLDQRLEELFPNNDFSVEDIKIITRCINGLIKCKNILLNDTPNCSNAYTSLFSLGDIVYIESKQEFGFIVGPFPSYVSSENPSYNVDINISSSYPTYLVVTLQKSSETTDYNFSFDSLLNTKKYTFRIRYCNKGSMKKVFSVVELNEKDFSSAQNSISDLETFCKYQCILDCNSECVLHKYNLYPKK